MFNNFSSIPPLSRLNIYMNPASYNAPVQNLPAPTFIPPLCLGSQPIKAIPIIATPKNGEGFWPDPKSEALKEYYDLAKAIDEVVHGTYFEEESQDPETTSCQTLSSSTESLCNQELDLEEPSLIMPTDFLAIEGPVFKTLTDDIQDVFLAYYDIGCPYPRYYSHFRWDSHYEVSRHAEANISHSIPMQIYELIKDSKVPVLAFKETSAVRDDYWTYSFYTPCYAIFESEVYKACIEICLFRDKAEFFKPRAFHLYIRNFSRFGQAQMTSIDDHKRGIVQDFIDKNCSRPNSFIGESLQHYTVEDEKVSGRFLFISKLAD